MLHPLFKNSFAIPFSVLLVSFVLNIIFSVSLNAERNANRKREAVNVPPVEGTNPIQPNHFPFRFNAQVVNKNVSMDFYLNSEAKLHVPFSEWYVEGRQMTYQNYHYVSFTGYEMDQPHPREVEVYLAIPLLRSSPLTTLLTAKEQSKVRTKLLKRSSMALRLLLPNFFLLQEQPTAPTDNQGSTVTSNCFDESMGSKFTTVPLPNAYPMVVDTSFHIFVVDSKQKNFLYNKIINDVLPQGHSCVSLANSLKFYNALAKATYLPPSVIPLFNFLLHDFKSPSPLGLLTALSFFPMKKSKDVFPSSSPTFNQDQVSPLIRNLDTLTQMYKYLNLRSVASIENSLLVDPDTSNVLHSESFSSFLKTLSFTLIQGENAVSKTAKLVSSLEASLVSPRETRMVEYLDTYRCNNIPEFLSIFFQKPEPKVSTSILNDIDLHADWVKHFSRTDGADLFISPFSSRMNFYMFALKEFQYLDTDSFFAVALPDSPMKNKGSLNENKNLYQVILIHEKPDHHIILSVNLIEELRTQLNARPLTYLSLFIPTFRLKKHYLFNLSQIPHLSTSDSQFASYFNSQFNLNDLQIHQTVSTCIGRQPWRGFNMYQPNTRTHRIDSPFYYVIVDKVTGVPIFYDKIEDVFGSGENCSG